MIISIKDLKKLMGIIIVACCAVFVCALFLNYHIDLTGIKDALSTPQEIIVYDAQAASGTVIVGVSGGCLGVTTMIMLVFYVKNYIDSHGKELGILKALGYSNMRIAKHFWVFGISVFAGTVLGYIGAYLYMPAFYEMQNQERLLPLMQPQPHAGLIFLLVILPTVFFMLAAVAYAYFKMKHPVIQLLKDIQNIKIKVKNKETKDIPFLQDLKKNTLRSRKTLVFFIGFSAFCFSAMTQMSMSMKDLSSESFSWMIISIGLILSFVTLLMSLTSVIKANVKTIAMMKVFGYSNNECSASILGGYRPVSYVGFIIGTLYQYLLLRIMVDIIFADFENIPIYEFNYEACMITLIIFIALYELIIYYYARKIGKQSVKGIMLE